jgi:hypothetical protein
MYLRQLLMGLPEPSSHPAAFSSISADTAKRESTPFELAQETTSATATSVVVDVFVSVSVDVLVFSGCVFAQAKGRSLAFACVLLAFALPGLDFAAPDVTPPFAPAAARFKPFCMDGRAMTYSMCATE